MRTIACLWLLVALSVLMIGCRSRDRTVSVGAPSDFTARLAAAKAISNTATRDEAFAQLAVDAAAAGEGDTAAQAVRSISYVATKDTAASKAALRLAKAGKGTEANTVANLISQTAVKDRVLAKIAKGDFSD